MGKKNSRVNKPVIIECSFCGAGFDEMLPKCPYCGSASIKGAEAEYMGKLENVRINMEDLGQVPVQETREEFKKQSKFFVKILLIMAAAIALLFAVPYLFTRSTDRDRQEDYAWQQENFPILDELYEQKKYEEMVELYYDALLEDKPVYAWEHYEFCSALELFYDAEETWAREQAGEELTHWDYEDLLYIGFRAKRIEENTAFSQEEKEILEPYIQKVTADFETRWDFTEEERAAFEKEAEENGWISYTSCEKYIDKWLEGSEK